MITHSREQLFDDKGNVVAELVHTTGFANKEDQAAFQSGLEDGSGYPDFVPAGMNVVIWWAIGYPALPAPTGGTVIWWWRGWQ